MNVEILKSVTPDYPIVEMSTPHEGFVIVEFVMGTDGIAKDVKVVDIKSVPTNRYEDEFARSAVRTIKKWRYKAPARECTYDEILIFKLVNE